MSVLRRRHTLPMSTEESRLRDRVEFAQLTAEFLATRQLKRAQFIEIMRLVAETDMDDWLPDSDEEQEGESCDGD